VEEEEHDERSPEERMQDLGRRLAEEAERERPDQGAVRDPEPGEEEQGRDGEEGSGDETAGVHGHLPMNGRSSSPPFENPRCSQYPR